MILIIKETHPFIIIMSTTMYYKILNQTMNHHGFQYKEGVNVDIIPFHPSGECQAGGLYFTDWNHIHEYISYGTLLADVSIPDDALVYQETTSNP